MSKNSHALTYFKLFLTATFWGGTFIAGRSVANSVEPFSAAFLRFTIASSVLLFVTCKIEGKLPSIDRPRTLPIILLGLTGVFFYNFCFFQGLKFIHAGRASLIVATNPIFISLFSAYFFNERLSSIKISGIVLSVIGAIIVISRGSFLEFLNGNLGWGELYIFGCVVSWVTYSLIGKSVMKTLSPAVAVTYSSVVGTVALFLPALHEGVLNDLSQYSKLDWLGLAYLGLFGTVLGFLWYYQGIRNIGPTKAGQFINFVPISAILLAFFILGEPVTVSLAVGAISVISGVYMTNSTFSTRNSG